MDKESFNLFAKLALHEMKNSSIKDKEIQEFLSKEFMPRVIKGRLKGVLDKDISDHALLFLSSILDSPGKSTMMTACIAYKLKDSKVTLNNLGMEVFPNGFPTEEQWSKLWESQKVQRVKSEDPDNMLDYRICYH
jgi:hypothetical protein